MSIQKVLKEQEELFKKRFKVQVEKHKSGSFMGFSLWDNELNDFASKESLSKFHKQSNLAVLQAVVDLCEENKGVWTTRREVSEFLQDLIKNQ